MESVENIETSLPTDAAKSPSEIPPSGVRPSVATLAARVEAALASSVRTEAALADIFRTAKFLSATVKAVRDANSALRRELLELKETNQEAFLDQELLVADHDEFIAMLVADHEREIEALRAQLTTADETDSPPPSSDGVVRET